MYTGSHHKTAISYLWLSLIGMTVFLCASCSNSDKDQRSEADTANIERVATAIDMREKDALALCDSLMSAANDSLIYYDYLLLKGRYYLLSTNPREALPYAEKALAFCRDKKKSKRIYGLIGKAQSLIANVDHLYRSNHQKAVDTYLQAFRNTTLSDCTDNLPLIAANLADAYIFAQDLPNATLWYRKALFLADSLSISPGKTASIYIGLGQIYTAMGNYSTAKHYYALSEKNLHLLPPPLQAYLLNNYGNLYYFSGEYDNALNMFQRLHTFLENDGEPDGSPMATCQINLADVYLNKQMIDSALYFLNAAEPFFVKHHIFDGIHYANSIRIGIATYTRQFHLVPGILAKEEKGITAEENIERIRNKYLDHYYQAIGDYETAYQMSKRWKVFSDSTESYKQKMRIAEIMMRFTEDTLRLHHQIELEQNDIELGQAKATLWAFACLTTLLLGVIVYSSFYFHKRRLQNRIDFMNLKLENIRHRISPHFIFNLLNSKIGKKSQEEDELLVSLSNIIRQNLDMITETYVSLKKELDFVSEYVHLERNLLGENFTFTVNVAPGIDTDNILIPSMFLQILTENAIKHGLKARQGETLLNIDISDEYGGVSATVTDNGIGFDIRNVEELNGGIGLTIIRNTIALINKNNKETNRMRFSIKNIEADNGTILGCKSKIFIPYQIELP